MAVERTFPETKTFSSALRWQHPFRNENANWHRSKPLHQECEWKQGDPAVGKGKKPFLEGKTGRTLWRLPLVGDRLFRSPEKTRA